MLVVFGFVGILELTRRARYLSFHAFLLAEHRERRRSADIRDREQPRHAKNRSDPPRSSRASRPPAPCSQRPRGLVHVQKQSTSAPRRCRSLPVSPAADRPIGSDPAAMALPSSNKARPPSRRSGL